MNTKPRILLLESLASISGGQWVVIDLAPALAKNFDVTVVLPGDGALANELRVCGAEVKFVSMSSYTLVSKGWRDALNFVLETPRLTFALARLIRQHDVRLVYANNSRTFIWGTLGAWLSRKPIIWHAHNVLLDRKTRFLVSLFARFPNVRNIICPSDSAVAQFSQRNKVMVVPSGIDLEKFVPSTELGDRKRAEWNIAPNALAVGIVGDLIPLKGQDIFIRAATQVASIIPNAMFLIIGDARPTEESRRYQAELETLIHNSQFVIRAIGFQSDMVAALNALDVLVVASTTETGPLVLLQALACGVPVVSTPVGLASRLLSGGECGELFPVNDHTALTEKLIRLLSDRELRKQMGSTARRRAVQEFDLKNFQSKITTLIQGILDQ